MRNQRSWTAAVVALLVLFAVLATLTSPAPAAQNLTRADPSDWGIIAVAPAGWSTFAGESVTVPETITAPSFYTSNDTVEAHFRFDGNRMKLVFGAATGQTMTTGRWERVTEDAFLVRPSLSVVNLTTGGSCPGSSDVDIETVEFADDRITAFRASVVYRCAATSPPATLFIEYSAGPRLSNETWVGPRVLDLGEYLSWPRGASLLVVNRSSSATDVAVDTGLLSGFATTDSSCQDQLLALQSCVIRLELKPYDEPAVLDEQISVTTASGIQSTSIRAVAATATLGFTGRGDGKGSTLFDHTDENFAVEEALNGEVRINAGLYAMQIRPPRYERLQVGTYTVDTSVEAAFGDGPRLSVARLGMSCDLDRAEFTVHEVGRDENQQLTRLRVSTRTGCGSRSHVSLLAYNTAFASPLLSVDRNSEGFGSAGGPGSVEVIAVTNIGDRPAEVGATLIGNERRDYWLADTGCIGVTLQPNETCDQAVGYQPFGRGFERTRGELVLSTGGEFDTTSVRLFGNAPRSWEPGPASPRSLESGYWVLQTDGNVTPLGDARHMGDTTGSVTPMIEIRATPTGRGYWLLDIDGNVFPHGDARDLGRLTDADRAALTDGEVAISMSATPGGNGYWVFTTRGRVFRFGDAQDIGSLAHLALDQPIIDAVSTPSGLGVYMIGLDGGVFALGDATFAGSVPQVLPGVELAEPVVGIVPDPDGLGYWLVAADGGVFAFNAHFNGSIPGVLEPGTSLRAAVNGMATYGDGYLLIASDGGIFNFSSSPFSGSLADESLDQPVIAVAPVVDDSAVYG